MKTKRILVIEDDVELCEELVDSLRGEGFFAESVHDPGKAEGLLRSDEYDTVLLDYKMPVASGLDLLKKVKAHIAGKRIIVITGRPSVERMIADEDLWGVVSFVIPKPINFELLLQKIREA